MTQLIMVCASAILVRGNLDSSSYCRVIGRSLTWDPKEAYPLDAETPLSSASQKIVKYLMEDELGRAESLARYRLKVDRNDPVPAWVLGQIVRCQKRALAEYKSYLQRSAESETVPQLLYALHVCRLAENELPVTDRRSGNPRYEEILREQSALADRLRPYALRDLGVAIGVTQVSLDWVVEDRDTLRRFIESHPKGPDLRPLLAQALMSGMHYGPKATLFSNQATDPKEPHPEKGLEVAQSILKDKPNDPLGHYYAGVARFYLKQTALAVREFQAALATGMLPPPYELGAQRFIERPSFPALRVNVVY